MLRSAGENLFYSADGEHGLAYAEVDIFAGGLLQNDDVFVTSRMTLYSVFVNRALPAGQIPA